MSATKKVLIIGAGASGLTAIKCCLDEELEPICFERTDEIVKLIGGTETGCLRRVTAENSWPLRFLQAIIPTKLVSFFVESQLNRKFDHAAYSLKPKHMFFAQHPTVNDDLPNRIVSGMLTVKPDIKRFTSTGIEFEDGSIEEDIDVVLLCTGYKFGFPFLDESVIKVENNRVDLYKYVFPPDLRKQTLAVIGCIQPLGAIMPISEQQCRLFTRVLKGDVKLPTREEMWADMKRKETAMAQRYVKSQRHTIQVDYVNIMDELAELNGNKPDLGKLMMSDPKLALTCFFGPACPYQYRLDGPGKWNGAREAILTQWDRIYYSLKTRPLGFEESKTGKMLVYAVLVIVFAVFLNLIFKFF